MSNYEKLAAINVNDKIEKKNGLSYLSWAWAVDQLLRADPAANWEYHEPKNFGETMMVSCTVTAFGKGMTCHLPVMDYKNKAIHSPDSFAVNTAMQRCLVKAIALHGLGLYIYAGEDLPQDGEINATKEKSPVRPNSVGEDAYNDSTDEQRAFYDGKIEEIRTCLSFKEIQKAARFFYESNLQVEEMAAIWSQLSSEERSAIKKWKPEEKK